MSALEQAEMFCAHGVAGGGGLQHISLKKYDKDQSLHRLVLCAYAQFKIFTL